MQSLERSLKILEFVAKNPQKSMNLSKIADGVGLHAATCARILSVFVKQGYIHQKNPRKGYSLGYKLFQLTENGPVNKLIIEKAEPELVKLSQILNETVLLASIHKGKRLILSQIAPDQIISIKNERVFSLSEPLKTATGRLLLAYMDEDKRNSLLSNINWPNNIWPQIENKSQLDRKFEEIRKNGYEVNITENHTVGIACPVKKNQTVDISVGVFMPAYRFEEKSKDVILEKLFETCKEIETKFKDTENGYKND